MPTETEQTAGLATPPAEPSDNFLSQDQYRAVREGRAEPPKPAAKPGDTSDAQPGKKPAAETADESETADDTGEDSQEDKDKGKGKKGERLNARFSELTGKIRDLKSELDAERAKRAGGAGTEDGKAKPAAQAAEDPEPKPEDFKDYLEYQKQWNRWDRRQDDKARAAEAEKQRLEEATRARATAWTGRVSEAKAKHADFAEVAQNPDLPVTRVMADAITDSELGTEILYHLGKNPTEAARISKLAPLAQIRAIGALEIKLTPADESTEDEKTPPAKTVSKAPPPPKPLHTPAASTSVKAIENMTQAEYRALREANKL